MSKDVIFPFPEDRTINDPAVLLSTKEVLAVYNRYLAICNQHGDQLVDRVTEHVQQYIVELADDKGWKSVEFIGAGQCLLKSGIVKS